MSSQGSIRLTRTDNDRFPAIPVNFADHSQGRARAAHFKMQCDSKVKAASRGKTAGIHRKRPLASGAALASPMSSDSISAARRGALP
jgi:hypothetical protein